MYSFFVTSFEKIVCTLVFTTMNYAFAYQVGADDPAVSTSKNMRVGIIGLDTSHSPAFAKAMNDPDASGALSRMQVVAAFPAGSPDIKSSADRVEGYTKELKEMGVQIVNSVDELVQNVDAVMVESLDGRPHLLQALAMMP